MDDFVQVTEEEKNNIYSSLLDTVLSGLEGGITTDTEAQESASFILNGLEQLKTQKELITFLEELSSNWPVYSTILQKQIEEFAKKQDNQKIEKTLNQIENLSN